MPLHLVLAGLGRFVVVVALCALPVSSPCVWIIQPPHKSLCLGLEIFETFLLINFLFIVYFLLNWNLCPGFFQFPLSKSCCCCCCCRCCCWRSKSCCLESRLQVERSL